MEMIWDPIHVRARRGRVVKPGSKWGHTVNALEEGRLLYVFGGYSSDDTTIGAEYEGGHHANDVFVFDTVSNTWSRPKLKGVAPSPRDSHTCTLVGKDLFVFGGTNGLEQLNDLHVLDTVAQKWTTPPTSGVKPPPREGHGAALIDTFLCIFGGTGTITEDGEEREKCLNDLYILDTQSFHWTRAETHGTPPAPRNGLTCIAYNKMLIVLGGVDDSQSNESYFGDVSVLNTDTMFWNELLTAGDKPIPRAGHVTIALDKYLIVFGGFTDGNNLTSDVYVLDLEAGVWEKAFPAGEGPSPRFSGAGASIDPSKGVFVFIGGCNNVLQPLSDMFCLHVFTPLQLFVEESIDTCNQNESVMGNDPLANRDMSMVEGFYPSIDDFYHRLLCQNIPEASSTTTEPQMEFLHDADTAVSDIHVETRAQTFKAEVTQAFHSGDHIKANVSGNTLHGILFSANPSRHQNAVRRSLNKKPKRKVHRGRKPSAD